MSELKAILDAWDKEKPKEDPKPAAAAEQMISEEYIEREMIQIGRRQHEMLQQMYGGFSKEQLDQMARAMEEMQKRYYGEMNRD